MQQKFLSNFSLLIFLNLLVKLFWIFGIDVVVQNTLGTMVYGDFFALFNFAFIFAIIADLGINQYNNRIIAGEPDKLSNALANILVVKVLLFATYLVVLAGLSFVMGYNTMQLKLLLIIGLNQGLISFYNYFRSNVSALHLFKTESFLSVSDKFVMIVLCAALLWFNPFPQPFTIFTFAWVQVIGMVAGVGISFAVLFRFIKRSEIRISRRQMLDVLKNSYPYAILITLMSFYTRLDAVMIERLLPDGAEEAGIYASGFRLLDSLNMFAVLMANMLLPMLARLIHRQQPVNSLVKQSFSVMLLPCVAVPLLCFFYRDDLYKLIYPDLYTPYSADVFALVICAFAPIATGYIFGTLLTAGGKLRQLNFFSIVGLFANFLLNLVLIPEYKAVGACIATLVTQSLVVGLSAFYGARFYKLSLRGSFVGSALLYTMLAGAAVYLLTLVNWNWKLEFILLSLAIAGFALISRLVKIKEIFQSFRPSDAA